MKKSILAYLVFGAIIFGIILNLNIVNAETQLFYYITDDTTMIIDDPVVKGKIRLPKSYYVQATNESDSNINGEIFKTIKYNGIKGKVSAKSLSVKTLFTNKPYYVPNEQLATTNTHSVILKFYIVDNGEVINGKELTPSTQLTFISNTSNAKYYFVKIEDNTYGFVEKAYCNLANVIIPPNAQAINPDTDGNTPLNPDMSDNGVVGNKSNTLKIILITSICLLSVFIVFLIFKPVKNKKPPKGDFYDI